MLNSNRALIPFASPSLQVQRTAFAEIRLSRMPSRPDSAMCHETLAAHKRRLHAHHRTIPGINALDLACDQPIGNIAEPSTSEIRRNRAAEKAEFAHFAENRRIRFFMPERVTRALSQSTLRVIARRLPNQPLLLGGLALQAEQIIPVELLKRPVTSFLARL
jgi:hypothetical protein